MKLTWVLAFGWIACALAQAPSQSPGTTMKQLMLDLIYPASNDVLLLTYRGGPQNEKEWAEVRHSALTLAESGNLLAARGQGDWLKHARALADVGAALYKAAQGKDSQAIAALTRRLDASCTACHKQYRPNVFPPSGGPK
jgi:hypothetical protein